MIAKSVELPSAIVADDDEFFRLAMGGVLVKHCGFGKVMETVSLDDALARLGEAEGRETVSLVLLDLDMPGMQGAASLSAVRECFPETRVAVVTASTRRQDVLRALEAGAHGFVPKGLVVGETVEAIRMVQAGIIYVPAWLANAPPADQPSALVEPTMAPLGGSASEPPRNPPGGALPGLLTRRQVEVLRLVAVGRSNKEIARMLDMGHGTVKVHVAALLRSFRTTSRAGVAAAAARILGEAPVSGRPG